LNRTKSKKIKFQKSKKETVDPDHFTVFNLKVGWEKVMSDVWSPSEIQRFKERQELLSTIPVEQRNRTKLDKSYREGWVDAATWTLKELQKIFRSLDEKNTYDSVDKIEAITTEELQRKT
jgi:hypothetical protein